MVVCQTGPDPLGLSLRYVSALEWWVGAGHGNGLRWASTISGPVTTYASSDIAERGFCSTCGTALWVRDIKTADTVIDLMPGLFENACGAVLDHEAYADRCPDGYALAGTHARVSKAEYERSQPHV